MKYIVDSPLKSGGKRHEPGSVVALADAVAAPLLESGVIRRQQDVGAAEAAARKAAADAEAQAAAEAEAKAKADAEAQAAADAAAKPSKAGK